MPILPAASFIFFISLLSFHFRLDLKSLDPKYIDWLLSGDPGSYLLAWEYFRKATVTSFVYFDSFFYPFGANIALTDTIPGIPLILRHFEAELSRPFQYFGIWVFLCLIGNALYGYLFAQLYGLASKWKYLLSAVFAFAPVLLFRIGHFSLCSHFMILTPLYVYLFILKKRRLPLVGIAFQFLIMSFGLFISPYLLAMNLFLFLALLLMLFLMTRQKLVPLWRLTITLVFSSFSFASIFLSAKILGYLSDSKLTSSGLANYSFDMLSLINPYGYSILMPQLRSGAGQYEGFSYPGLGILLALTVIFSKRKQLGVSLKKYYTGLYLPLSLALTLLLFYSFSPEISFGGNTIIDITWLYRMISPLPEMFRVTGRFFWPCYYLLLVFTIVKLSQLNSFKVRSYSVLFFAFVLVQAIDITPFLWSLRAQPIANDKQTFQQTRMTISQTNNIKRAYLYPARIYYADGDCPGPVFSMEDFLQIGLALAEQGIPMNSGFMARVPEPVKSLCNLPNESQKKEAGNLYIIHKDFPEDKFRELCVNKMSTKNVSGHRFCWSDTFSPTL